MASRSKRSSPLDLADTPEPHVPPVETGPPRSRRRVRGRAGDAHRGRRRAGFARGRARIVVAPVRRSEVRADARRAHRVANRRQQVDQRSGGEADLARAAGDERRRPRRDRHRADRRSPADGAPGPGRVAPPGHPRLDAPGPETREDSRRRRLHDGHLDERRRGRRASWSFEPRCSRALGSAHPPAWTPPRRCGCSGAGRSLRARRGRRPRTHVVSEGETGRPCDRRHRADHPGGGTDAVGDLDIASVATGSRSRTSPSIAPATTSCSRAIFEQGTESRHRADAARYARSSL